jgi:hypothetical protein
MIVPAMKSNLQGIFTDCPHRERLGWLKGSVTLSLCTAADSLYNKFIHIFGASFSGTTMRPNPRLARAVLAAREERGPQLRPEQPLRQDRAGHGRGAGEKDAELVQKLGQLQLFAALFPQQCMGQLASFGPA